MGDASFYSFIARNYLLYRGSAVHIQTDLSKWCILYCILACVTHIPEGVRLGYHLSLASEIPNFLVNVCSIKIKGYVHVRNVQKTIYIGVMINGSKEISDFVAQN